MRRLPVEFTNNIPERLSAAQAPAAEGELAAAGAVRRRFAFKGHSEPYVHDIVRAFRLARGLSRYVEIGTHDKGNLAYVSDLLAPDAVIVDVDIAPNPEREKMLRGHARQTQTIHTVIGDSGRDETFERVVGALGGKPADLVFIDGNHTALYHLNDYAMYSRLVRPGGLVFMHDVYWVGDAKVQGSCAATLHIDRLTPVYVVEGPDKPVHRFCPTLAGSDDWGRVGIILKH
jgi:predicted O-methyltransferase YrrM